MASAVIVAAGHGKRLQSPVAKQFLEIEGKPLFIYTLEAFARHSRVARIQLVVPPGDISLCRSRLPAKAGLDSDIRITAGGASRQESVYKGLLALEDLEDTQGVVVIHDGVRPFVSQELISACIDGAVENGACIAAVPVSDTLKRVDKGNLVTETVARDRIWLAQTPQAFRLDLIKNAFDKAIAEGFTATDDASIVERTGRPVRIIEGSWRNIKITTPADLEIAAHLIKFFKTSNGNSGGKQCQTK